MFRLLIVFSNVGHYSARIQAPKAQRQTLTKSLMFKAWAIAWLEQTTATSLGEVDAVLLVQDFTYLGYQGTPGEWFG